MTKQIQTNSENHDTENLKNFLSPKTKKNEVFLVQKIHKRFSWNPKIEKDFYDKALRFKAGFNLNFTRRYKNEN